MTRTLLDLAEKVEALTGPDRWVDGDIAHALGLFPDGFIRWNNESIMSGIRWQKAHEGWDAPAYTASIDSAITLVPEGWSVLSAWNGRDAICTVHLKPLGDPNGFWPPPGKGCSPALALTAAALKARATISEKNQ